MLVWVNDLHIYGAVGKINYRKTKADHHHAFPAGGFLPDGSEDHSVQVRPGICEERNADGHGEITGSPDDGDRQGHAAEGKPHACKDFQNKGCDIYPHLVLPAIIPVTQLQERETRESQCKP